MDTSQGTMEKNILRLWNKLTTCNKERMLYKVFNNDYNMCADKSGWCSRVKEY